MRIRGLQKSSFALNRQVLLQKVCVSVLLQRTISSNSFVKVTKGRCMAQGMSLLVGVLSQNQRQKIGSIHRRFCQWRRVYAWGGGVGEGGVKTTHRKLSDKNNGFSYAKRIRER
jgi:hypothetical protein